IGQHILQRDELSDRTSKQFISQLTDIILNSVDVKDPGDENLTSKCCFLLAIWHKKESLSLKFGSQETLEHDWKCFLQIVLLDTTVQYHNNSSQNSNMFIAPEGIYLIKLCRCSAVIFQEAVSILANFVMLTRGCNLFLEFVKEFMKRINFIPRDEFVNLFPSEFKKLVCHLQTPPDGGDDNSVAMELITMAFKKDKQSAFSLMMCFPLWLRHLVQYYQQTYNQNFFIQFQF
ncbi:hypothetical protein L9F63_013183, partial [Diploptera punctata]